MEQVLVWPLPDHYHWTVLAEGKTDAGRKGFTLIEILVVLAVLAILLAIAIPNLRTPAVRLAADAAHSYVQQARFDAIRLNRPVMLSVQDAGTGLNMAQLTTSAHVICSGTATPLSALELSEFRQVQIQERGHLFLWLPNGQPRSCSGQPLPGELSITLGDGNRSQQVVVSTGGAVTIR